MSNPIRPPDPVRDWRHEMRNVINALQLSALAMETCDEAAERLDFLKQVEISADAMLTLLDRIPAELEPTSE